MRVVLFAAPLLLGLSGCANSPLKSAVASNDPAGVNRALTAGESLDSNVPGMMQPPVVYACWHGSFDVLKLLVQKGAKLNGDFKMSPIFACMLKHHPEMVRYLIEHGAVVTENDIKESRTYGRDLTDFLAAERSKQLAALNRPASVGLPAAAPAPEKRELASDVDTPSRRGVERPDDFALVIGIEDYQSLPKADFGARDAQTVRKHFEALGVPARNIIALEGSKATGSKMRSYLQQWLPRNVKPTSTVFVYYSGHGAPDPESGDAYLVPWDADPMFLTTSAYPLKQFYAELSRLKAKRVLVALDACFSGSGGRSVLAKGARPLVSKVDESVPAAANLTVLAAASGGEITGSLDEQGHGIFTYYFLKGLSSGAATPRALFDYLKPKVQDDARRQNREQSPTIAGAGGDVAF